MFRVLGVWSANLTLHVVDFAWVDNPYPPPYAINFPRQTPLRAMFTPSNRCAPLDRQAATL
jgi:hypothetical protein